ncbi:hypothetical protein Pfo_003583 [Paulownia fortunei]|nr:hypothetical protein Pfo_003583 [Paulownia fortunei]
MVYFKDISSSSGVQYLVILDDESQTMENSIILTVYDPLVGRYAKQWPRLMNPFYLKEWSREIPLSKTSKVGALQATHLQQSNEPTLLPTLGHRIIESNAKWGDAIQFLGEFHYIKGYWEWTEDILSQCEHKLLAAQIYNSVYASLFTYDRKFDIDLHTLAGLPVIGFLYDEVVSCAKELIGVDEAGSRFVPRSCNHLLHAYHLLQRNANGDQPSQSKKIVRYHSPPPRREKKIVHPKSTHNPLGDFAIHGEWSPAEKALFSKLGVKESSREETHLAAYLACWLCTFVLPSDDINLIRSSTFKMASIMASR